MRTQHRNWKTVKMPQADLIQNLPQVREKIVTALNNPKYTARTISGISKEAHLTRAAILKAIKSDKVLGSTVKIVPVRAKDGQLLITTKERFINESSLKDKFIDFFASKRVSIKSVE